MKAIVVLVVLAVLGTCRGDLSEQLQYSADVWESHDLHEYCYTTATPFLCDTLAETTLTVRDDGVSMIHREYTLCNDECKECKDQAASAPPQKGYDLYTMNDWYQFCAEVITWDVEQYDIYFQLFSDEHKHAEMYGLLQLCGYKPKGADESEFVGVMVMHVGVGGGVPDDGVCVAPSETDPEGDGGGEQSPDEVDVNDELAEVSAQLEQSESVWHSLDTTDYCYVSERDDVCDNLRTEVYVHADRVQARSLALICTDECKHCRYENAKPRDDDKHTLDFWYEWCANSALQQDPEQFEIFVSFFEDTKLLQQCGYVDRSCADDCYVGITVASIGVGRDEREFCHVLPGGPPPPPPPAPAGGHSGSGNSGSSGSGSDSGAGDSSWLIGVYVTAGLAGVLVLLVVAVLVFRYVRRKRSKHPYEGYETYHPSDWL